MRTAKRTSSPALEISRTGRHCLAIETLESRQMLAADLVGSAFDVTGGQPLPAGQISVTMTIKNLNGIWFLDDAGPFQAQVFLSPDNTIGDAGDIDIGTALFQNLGAGQSITRTINVSVPATDPFMNDNDYRIGIVVDSADQVAESNENNNSNQGNGKDSERVWFENHVLNPAAFVPKCQQLAVGGSISGAIGGTDERMGALDIDSYEVVPAPGQTLAFDLDTTSSGWQSTIRLIQLNNRQYTWDSGTAAPGEPNGTGDSLIRWYFPFNIPMFIAVSGAGNSASDPCYLTGRTPASQGSYTLSVVVVPNAPSAPDLDDSSDTYIYNDNITKATSLKFNLNGQAGKIAQLYVDGIIRATDANGTAGGQYQFNISGLSDGTHTITANLLDPTTGYTSDFSAPLTVKTDTSVPPAPAPDLTSGSDTGLSNSDNITNDTTPTFAGTTEPDGIVELYRNGTFLISSTASASGAWSLTPTISGDGTSNFTIRVRDLAGNFSTMSTALPITLDTAGPTLTSPMSFGFDTSPHHVSMAFSDDVSATLSAGDLTVTNLATSATVGVGSSYAQQQAVYTFTGFPVLPQGNYRATLNSAGVTDVAGNGVVGNTVLDFFVMPGDANHDRSVDVSDLGILATNWQGIGKTFSQADFNYDGKVDVSDLGIVATYWQATLQGAAPASAPMSSQPMVAAVARGAFSSRRMPQRVDLVQSLEDVAVL
jgi:hypothetical protein